MEGKRSLLFDLILFSIIDFVLLTCLFIYGRKFTNKSTAFKRRSSDAALDGKNVKERHPTGGGIMSPSDSICLLIMFFNSVVA
jgi:hypothetical protein